MRIETTTKREKEKNNNKCAFVISNEPNFSDKKILWYKRDWPEIVLNSAAAAARKSIII